MPKLNEEKLTERINEGKVTPYQLLRALATERNSCSIVTMPTIGAMSHDLNQSEAAARQSLNAIETEAAHNVAVLKRVMAAHGFSTKTYVCENCGKHRPSRACPMCETPEEY